jgi:hypothetical protein
MIVQSGICHIKQWIKETELEKHWECLFKTKSSDLSLLIHINKINKSGFQKTRIINIDDTYILINCCFAGFIYNSKL